MAENGTNGYSVPEIELIIKVKAKVNRWKDEKNDKLKDRKTERQKRQRDRKTERRKDKGEKKTKNAIFNTFYF